MEGISEKFSKKNKNKPNKLDKFSNLTYIYIYKPNKMNTNKRQYRELNPETKAKISQSLKGRGKSDTHKEAISQGLKAYWNTIPNKPSDGNKVAEN